MVTEVDFAGCARVIRLNACKTSSERTFVARVVGVEKWIDEKDTGTGAKKPIQSGGNGLSLSSHRTVLFNRNEDVLFIDFIDSSHLRMSRRVVVSNDSMEGHCHVLGDSIL